MKKIKVFFAAFLFTKKQNLPSLIPKSLAGRTILILLAGFAIVQLLGLVIQTFNQMQLERIDDQRALATRAAIIYRHIALAQPADRPAAVMREPLPRSDGLALVFGLPPVAGTAEMPLAARQIIRASIFAYGIPPAIRPHGLVVRESHNPLTYIIIFGLPGPPESLQPFPPPPGPPPDMNGNLPPPALMPVGYWLVFTSPVLKPEPWRSPGFATAFIVMTLLGAVMISWAVRQLLIPVRLLAEAADRLGRDVANAPDLPERGPRELVTAAAAFNTMARRVRRFVEDRTFLLSAIGHDLRTPITRLKLRAEYMEDDEQRQKMLADLDEMEAMVSATLAFGRDVTTSEPVTRLDLPALLRTILDEAADGSATHSNELSYEGPEHLAVQGRALGLKRAFTNLVSNALKYGDAAFITLRAPGRHSVQIDIDDQGPGIETADQETVFEPFRRLETSRNRETGGSGLGLSIARNILRAHGGDIQLINRPEGGLRARVTLPV
jgi:signal transduction histidine kinase